MRLLGATASGWLADRIGSETPLMISILWYSICNFIAGFSPSFWFLLLFRALGALGADHLELVPIPGSSGLAPLRILSTKTAVRRLIIHAFERSSVPMCEHRHAPRPTVSTAQNVRRS
jgi:MFS family permease